MTTVRSTFRYAGLDLALDLFLEPRAVAFGAVKIARQVIEGYADKLPNFSTAVLLKILRTSLKALPSIKGRLPILLSQAIDK